MRLSQNDVLPFTEAFLVEIVKVRWHRVTLLSYEKLKINEVSPFKYPDGILGERRAVFMQKLPLQIIYWGSKYPRYGWRGWLSAVSY